jgi:hypothetical protein
MDGSRSGFLKAAVTAAGAAATPVHAQGRGEDHGYARQAVPSDPTVRVKSLESLLVEKGLVDRKALDSLIDIYEHKVGPRNGARVVARSWVDSVELGFVCAASKGFRFQDPLKSMCLLYRQRLVADKAKTPLSSPHWRIQNHLDSGARVLRVYSATRRLQKPAENL